MTIESSDPHFIVDYSKKIKNKKYPNFLVIIYKVSSIISVVGNSTVEL